MSSYPVPDMALEDRDRAAHWQRSLPLWSFHSGHGVISKIRRLWVPWGKEIENAKWGGAVRWAGAAVWNEAVREGLPEKAPLEWRWEGCEEGSDALTCGRMAWREKAGARAWSPRREMRSGPMWLEQLWSHVAGAARAGRGGGGHVGPVGLCHDFSFSSRVGGPRRILSPEWLTGFFEV